MNELPAQTLSDWVPEPVMRYLAHTVSRRSIRDIARCAGCHASTILRQIRRVEAWRDDPLVDAALTALEMTQTRNSARTRNVFDANGLRHRKAPDMNASFQHPDTDLQTGQLEHHARIILRRLCESDAVLAVAENMEKAVVVRDSPDGKSTRTAVVDSEIAQAMALKGWIACAKPGRIRRYHITASGRSDLSRLLAQDESRASAAVGQGFAEANTAFEGAAPAGIASAAKPGTRRSRFSSAESPLAALARRKDRDGSPFLEDALVHAGERLREDFELAQIGPRVTQNWERFLTTATGAAPDSGTGDGSARARPCGQCVG